MNRKELQINGHLELRKITIAILLTLSRHGEYLTILAGRHQPHFLDACDYCASGMCIPFYLQKEKE